MIRFPPQKFFDFRKQRSFTIASIVAQVYFYLKPFLNSLNSYAPEEGLLLARYGETIDIGHGDLELDQLAQLTDYLVNRKFEKKHGYVDPIVAREVEREIVLRKIPEDVARGYDIRPVTVLLGEYERCGPVFTQPERNLLYRFHFYLGDRFKTESLAESFYEKRCTEQDIIGICRRLEAVELEWNGMNSIEGVCFYRTAFPGGPLDLEDCENPSKVYPPFALFPKNIMPNERLLLSNGTLVKRMEKDWWHSDYRQLGGTYTAPHFFLSNEKDEFVVADMEYQELFCQETLPEEDVQELTM